MQVQQWVSRELTTLYSEIQVTRPNALFNYVNNSLYRQVVEIDLLHEEVRNNRWCLGWNAYNCDYGSLLNIGNDKV